VPFIALEIHLLFSCLLLADKEFFEKNEKKLARFIDCFYICNDFKNEVEKTGE